jgi:hypothetical protein
MEGRYQASFWEQPDPKFGSNVTFQGKFWEKKRFRFYRSKA